MVMGEWPTSVGNAAEDGDGAVSTSTGMVLLQGLVGAPVVGLPVGAVLAVAQPDTEAWALFIGAIFGPILGFGFGLIGALALLVAPRSAPQTHMARAKRRDRISGTLAISVASVISALWWMSEIDLEGGRRLYEVFVLAIAPPVCALLWSFTIGMPHLEAQRAAPNPAPRITDAPPAPPLR